MSIETLVFTTLKDLVEDRVYRNIAPQTAFGLDRITFQQVGGDAVNFLDPARPSKKNARVQVNCWAQDLDSASALGRLAEDAMRAIGTVLGGLVTTGPEEATGVYGSRQDFSVWFDD